MLELFQVPAKRQCATQAQKSKTSPFNNTFNKIIWSESLLVEF
jgi:hypothetical protein